MFIDENKIRDASKKSIPSFRRFRKAGESGEGTPLQKIINFILIAALLSGVGILIWSLANGAWNYGKTLEKRESKNKAEYIQVIFKPNPTSSESTTPSK